MKKTRVEKLKKKEKKERKVKRKENRKKMIIVLVLLIIVFTLYSMFLEPRMLFVKERTLETEKISDTMHGLKIVQFSDLHYGTYYTRKNIKKLTKKINKLSPDIVIFTGDLVDDNYVLDSDDIKIITSEFSKINAKIGKYAIYGNHDVKLESYNNILYDSAFTLLKNDYDLVYAKDNIPILIYGLDDALFGKPSLDKLTEIDQNIYKIILVHEPDYIDKIDAKSVDLVLAGHSHNRQINIPIISNFVLPKGAKKYYKDHYKVNDTDLYVSNGVGCGFIQMRFMSFPSISLYRLTKKK